jgi:adenylosuccinate synthase
MEAVIVVGLAYGDEGKGSVVDYLVRTIGSKLVVRYNGGPQAAHNVVTDDDRHHTFSQFGSGGLVDGVKTYLSHRMLIEPFAMDNEWRHLHVRLPVHRRIKELLYIEEECPVITPFHWKANRAVERARGAHRHGSCGLGVGQLRSDQIYHPELVITVKDLFFPDVVEAKLEAIRRCKLAEIAWAHYHLGLQSNTGFFDVAIKEVAEYYLRFAQSVNVVSGNRIAELSDGAPVIFEGAQGVLLDEIYGFPPYNTWTNTTPKNAIDLCGAGENITTLGVIRTYMTRHGAGPFVTEDHNVNYLELHNGTGEWQGSFRQGHLDLQAVEYAAECCGGIDGIALTHCDCAPDDLVTVVTGYREMDGMTAMRDLATKRLMHCKPALLEEFTIDELAESLPAPIAIKSYGPTASRKSGLPVAKLLAAS